VMAKYVERLLASGVVGTPVGPAQLEKESA
jgi:hypothetical protein